MGVFVALPTANAGGIVWGRVQEPDALSWSKSGAVGLTHHLDQASPQKGPFLRTENWHTSSLLVL